VALWAAQTTVPKAIQRHEDLAASLCADVKAKNVNDPQAVADIATWAGQGGPGIVDPPEILDLYAFSPSRRIRAGLEEKES
ncbi:hypothetical protein AB0K87_35680, partial [Streptomyces sp. NPDC053705]